MLKSNFEEKDAKLSISLERMLPFSYENEKVFIKFNFFGEKKLIM